MKLLKLTFKHHGEVILVSTLIVGVLDTLIVASSHFGNGWSVLCGTFGGFMGATGVSYYKEYKRSKSGGRGGDY